MFEWITSIIAQLGYVGVAVLTFLENLFPPIPSELVIPLAGFVAAQGDLRLTLVIVMGSAASWAGALVWYAIGKHVGEERLRKWVGRNGRWLTLSEDDVDRVQQWFRRHGIAAVFFGRLIAGVRTFVSLPAGFSSMPLVASCCTRLLARQCGPPRWPTQACCFRRTSPWSVITSML